MTSTTPLGKLRRAAAGVFASLVVLAAFAGPPAMAQVQHGTAAAPGEKAAPPPAVRMIRFGVLPLGGTVESRALWTPLMTDMGRALGMPVSMYSVPTYEELDRAIGRDEIDMAFLSAKMALDAVMQRRMKVLAQIARHPSVPEHRAVLLVRKAGPLNTLEGLLAQPEKWRLARGDSRSVTGFIVPQSQLFLPHNIEMETRFRSEIVGTHQATALAVANGDADVATNNTTDFERFRQQFPVEAERLQVVWESEPPPGAPMVVRRDFPPEFQARLQNFLTGYGKAKGARGDAEREVLKSLRAAYGYVAADDSALLPQARLEHQLGRQRAMAASWVNEAAREQRLQRIEKTYAEQVETLRAAAR
ncbi:phosphate/phosphite/phosphonate ABC transporter substrate-binding protein [Variovorax sp. NFACC27]|uniref:phosphate/phosphite/phosphonate ABC transporter substrate-binding protein n=1 Tax=unclassified Variovorax TaxID=663243 RepID=UPI000894D577|nr:ABC transporter, phosphonate, substrate-binding protein [Variovorax sp. NFACC28]SEG53264.1 ABC transporter, phosphonate, substrate-binding protein [Variovorax sp. NFACC29]SFC16258.1 ABC transporter, phosphonate, substrate-binding protein [Variovorax sp. NFACC26]SFH27001.1 ABC transporter, phosphonate, substrate-binding protein [Variovorax sp. NFACC27]